MIRKSCRGQSTTEYFVMLAGVVAILIAFHAKEGLFRTALFNTLVISMQTANGTDWLVEADPPVPDCTPFTCTDFGMSCGSIFDGCGSYLTCGPPCATFVFCGNAICEPGEDCDNCGLDCPSCCGDGNCDGREQVACNCPTDCGALCTGPCGDGTCGPAENCFSCPIDCVDCCGDGFCDEVAGSRETCLNCPTDCGTCAAEWCGNLICEAGEDCYNCRSDCYATCCGDGTCGDTAYPWENYLNCPADCAFSAVCGDYVCDVGETAMLPPPPTYIYCPEDCAIGGSLCGNGVCDYAAHEDFIDCPTDCPIVCGDGRCATWVGENHVTCPSDCPVPTSVCGDGTCAADEACYSCSQDCPSCCGDGVVSPWTDLCDTCPAELPGCTSVCGDGVCEEFENCFTCRLDCIYCCGDGICMNHENCTTCSADCPCGGLLCGEPGFDCSGGQCGNCDACSPCCGDLVIDPGEVCDTINLGGETCMSLTGLTGNLRCAADCLSFDTSGCS